MKNCPGINSADGFLVGKLRDHDISEGVEVLTSLRNVCEQEGQLDVVKALALLGVWLRQDISILPEILKHRLDEQLEVGRLYTHRAECAILDAKSVDLGVFVWVVTGVATHLSVEVKSLKHCEEVAET